MVANVIKAKPSTMVTRIEVNKDQTIKAFSEDNALVAFYPATVGSEEKPSPSGTLKVLAVRSNPFYRYNPDYRFKGVRARRAFTINPASLRSGVSSKARRSRKFPAASQSEFICPP